MTMGSQHKVVFSDADITQEITEHLQSDSQTSSVDLHNHPIMTQFKLTEQLGHGGGGTVFAAQDIKLQRDVAIKMLRLDNHQHNKTILYEARIQAQIDHPNICKIFQVIEAEDNNQGSYLVMQLISGKPANLWRKQQTNLDINAILGWIRQVCSGLQALHAKDIVHRDIKPSNIMLDTDKYGQIHPYIVDFGIANQQRQRQYNENSLNGTPSYMSPEQFNNSFLDCRSDIFSLGATLYHLLTGQPPTRSSTTENLEHNFDNAQWHALPNEIKLIISKCMAFNPNERFPSAKALNDELGRLLGNEAIQINTNKAYRLRKSLLKNRWPFILAVTLLISVISLSFWLHWQNLHQTQLQQQLAKSLLDTKDIERNMLIRRLGPPENLSIKLTQWDQQLEQISAQIRQLPSEIQGQGYFNIGKIYYELQNYQKALTYLNQAWQNHYRQPNVAYYLATTHGAIYQQQKQLTEQLETNKLNTQDLTESNDNHKKLALEFLAIGAKAAPSVQFANTLNHFYNDEYDQALNQLKPIERLPNASYQHLTLHGDILMAKAQTNSQTNIGRASYYAQKAIAIYANAQEKGRSDWYLYLKSFHAYSLLLEKSLYGKKEAFNRLFTDAMEQINTAIKIMPEDYQAHYFKGLFLTRKSEFDDQHNDSALKTQKAAIEDLKKALNFSNNDPNVQSSLAVAYSQLISIHFQQNLPIQDLMNKSIAAFSNVPSSHQDYYYHNNYGTLHYNLGRHFSSMDNRPLNRLSTDAYYRTALLHFEKAQQLQPLKFGAKNNAILAQYSWAENSSRSDALEHIEKALEQLESIENIDEIHRTPFSINQARGYNKLAKIRASLGFDFREQITRAKAIIDLTSESKTSSSKLLAELSNTSSLAMIYQWQQGLFDVEITLETKQVLDKAIEQGGNNQRHINSATWLYLQEQQLKQLTEPNIVSSPSYDKALEFALKQQQWDSESLILLKLLNGQENEITQDNLLVLQSNETVTLIKALWYAQEKHFELAAEALEKLKNMPQSMHWAYQIQNLTRWQKHLQDNNEIGETFDLVSRQKVRMIALLRAKYPKLAALLYPISDHH